MSTDTQDIPLGKLHDSPFQHRTKYDVDELADSIRANGVLQSLLVRPYAKNLSEFELVAGHRRKRAAAKAGLATVPCIVRVMSDTEVQQAILVENAQREDLPPLEELKTYLELRKGGMEVEEIATKIGRPVGHVYRRLQLDRLCGEGKKALRKDTLALGVAEMIAGIKDTKDQARAVKFLAIDYDGRKATKSQAKRWIETNVTLLLKEADFDVNDPDLTKAGACTACPKNTAVSKMLFPELDRDPRCTDAKCFNAKRAAGWQARKKAELAKGRRVVDDKKGLEKFFGEQSWGGRLKAGWLDLRGRTWGPNGKNVSMRQAIGAARLKGIPVTLLRHEGRVYEVVPRKAVRQAVAAAPKKGDPYDIQPPRAGGTNASYKRTQAIQREYVQLLNLRLAQGIAANKLPEAHSIELWRTIAHGVAARAHSEPLKDAARARELELEKKDYSYNTHKVVHEWIDGKRQGAAPWEAKPNVAPPKRTATVTDLKVFVFETLIAPELHWGGTGHTLGALAGALGFDPKKVKKAATDEIKFQEREKARVKKEKDEARKARVAKRIAKKPELGVVCAECTQGIGKNCKPTKGKPVSRGASHIIRQQLAASLKFCPTCKASPETPCIEIEGVELNTDLGFHDQRLLRGAPAKKAAKKKAVRKKAKRVAKRTPKKTAKRKTAKANGKGAKVGTIAPDDGAAMLAAYDGGMSYADIGKAAGLSKHQVARRIKKAKNA